MLMIQFIGSIIAVALLAYLFYALFRPDKF
jgi:K+-transporting ATPase KdpF subunit